MEDRYEQQLTQLSRPLVYYIHAPRLRKGWWPTLRRILSPRYPEPAPRRPPFASSRPIAHRRDARNHPLVGGAPISRPPSPLPISAGPYLATCSPPSASSHRLDGRNHPLAVARSTSPPSASPIAVMLAMIPSPSPVSSSPPIASYHRRDGRSSYDCVGFVRYML